jgi:hypothetical protein
MQQSSGELASGVRFCGGVAWQMLGMIAGAEQLPAELGRFAVWCCYACMLLAPIMFAFAASLLAHHLYNLPRTSAGCA